METKDLAIIILAVIVVILAIVAVASFVGGDNDDVTGDSSNQISQQSTHNDNNKPYVVDRVWSDQYESYVSIYSNGRRYIEKTGAWEDDIS